MSRNDTAMDKRRVLTGPQIRAGRALLGISQPMLAAVAGVARQTVATVETQPKAPEVSGAAIRSALTDLGVEFIPGGARLKDAA